MTAETTNVHRLTPQVENSAVNTAFKRSADGAHLGVGSRTVGRDDAVPGDASHFDAPVTNGTTKDRVVDIFFLELHGAPASNILE
jgi:hypothetical protein